MRRKRDGPPRGRAAVWRWIRRAAALCCALVVVGALAGYPVYINPRIDPVRHADAIIVLGGPSYGRYPLGLELGAHGWAPTVVISNPNGDRDPWLARQCAAKQDFELYCFVPDPATTKGEGRELRRLAAERGWKTVIVVTFRPHVSRARFILEQCFDGQLLMTAPMDHLSAGRWALEYLYQTLGYLRAVLQPGC